jgi:PAS domain-containing protein
MPPLLILALVGAVLALLAKDEKDLPEQEQNELKKLQNDLAQARKGLRHAQNAKKRFVAQTGASIVNDDKWITISFFKNSSAELIAQDGNGHFLNREGKLRKINEYTSKEIISQLGIFLTHPREHVQELLPGQFSSKLLERYEKDGHEIKLLSSRDKNYLRRWFLSKVLTFGNLGETERVLATMVFNGNTEMERLFHLIVTKTIRRRTFLLCETYELCRALYPLYFPELPNVKDHQTEPFFLVTITFKQKRKISKSHRVRNPSAVGGKKRQGGNPLPYFSSGETGPSNVDEIFLETYKLISSRNASPSEELS